MVNGLEALIRDLERYRLEILKFLMKKIDELIKSLKKIKARYSTAYYITYLILLVVLRLFWYVNNRSRSLIFWYVNTSIKCNRPIKFNKLFFIIY